MKNMTGEFEGAEGKTMTRGLLMVAAATALILLVPLVAMQFTDEVVWTAGDFVVAAVLLLGAGSAFVFVQRKVTHKGRRTLISIAIGVALLLVWAELAVGIIGTLPFSGS